MVSAAINLMPALKSQPQADPLGIGLVETQFFHSSAPLPLRCGNQLDEFTLNLLGNDEIEEM